MSGGVEDDHIHICVAFRHAYFEFHAKIRLRFKLPACVGEAWTRDGGIPQGCPLIMELTDASAVC